MKVTCDRKFAENLVKRNRYHFQSTLVGEALNLKRIGSRKEELRELRVNYAASRIQGIIRGFLIRCGHGARLQTLRAAIMIQSLIRGKLGRIAWKRAFWLTTAVAKTPAALKDLLLRSSVVRQLTKRGMTGYDWQELLDPVTDAYFYYDACSGHSTWDCPIVMQTGLVCTWNGIRSYNCSSSASIVPTCCDGQSSLETRHSLIEATGGKRRNKSLHRSKVQQKKGVDMFGEEKDASQCCRSVFTTLGAFHVHLRDAHRWYCPACETRNTGVCFPVCALCGNIRNGEGASVKESLAAGMARVQERLNAFLEVSKSSSQGSESCRLKNRVIEAVRERRQVTDKLMSCTYDDDCSEDEGEEEVRMRRLCGVATAHTRLRRDAKRISSMEGMHSCGGHYERAHENEEEEEGSHSMKAHVAMIASLNYTRSLLYMSPAVHHSHIMEPSFLHTAASISDNCLGRSAPMSSSTGRNMDTTFPPLLLSDGSHAHTYAGTEVTSALSHTNRNRNKRGWHRAQLNKTPERSVNYPSMILGSELSDKSSVKSVSLLSPPSLPPRAMRVSYAAVLSDTAKAFAIVPMKGLAVPTDTLFKPVEAEKEKGKGKENELEGRLGEDIYSKNMMSYRTVTTVAQYNAFEKKGFTSAEQSSFSDPLGMGIIFEEELMDAIEGVLDPESDSMRLQRRLMKRKNGEENARSVSGVRESGSAAGGDRRAQYQGLSLPLPTCAHTNIAIGATGLLTESANSKNKPDRKSREGRVVSWIDNSDRNRMLVCDAFLRKVCSLSCCPLAHPGLRDSALITYGRAPGSSSKVPLVSLCADCDPFRDSCTLGIMCTSYHVYIRPSTAEIILKMYPPKQGRRVKQYPSGAVQDGTYSHCAYNGPGVFTWPSNDTYRGDWVEGNRQGFGVFTSAGGSEYIGGWDKCARHGLGVFTTVTGDEYAGEFHEGKMQGVGRLISCNGDVYEGGFWNNRYHGIGTFLKKGGNRFTGWCEKGEAHGVGILTLISGEKYTGYFDRNFRHGPGVCTYRDGSRYSGQWYRGSVQGAGAWVSREGEKYIGQWAAGKKHGPGRYYFLNGDFYDGCFHKDVASGLGSYHHTNGNMYSGEWLANKRNGKGTYTFQNGSKFTGSFEDNNIHGKGKFDFKSGCFYRGEFKRNIVHGRGNYTWSSGAVYKGTFFEGKISGHGEMIYADFHRYVGQWLDNKKHGTGSLSYREGHVYMGEWVQDERHGNGIITFSPGTVSEEKYDGSWVHDVMHGQGRYVYRVDEGTVYTGTFVSGVRTGQGLLSYKDGSFYRGSFLNEQMSGRGVYVSSDGCQYDGDWHRNMRHGTGTSVSSDGSIYHGAYSCNMRSGEGSLEDADGGTLSGVWESGVAVGKGIFKLRVGDSYDRPFPFQESSSGPGSGQRNREIRVKVFAL